MPYGIVVHLGGKNYIQLSEAGYLKAYETIEGAAKLFDKFKIDTPDYRKDNNTGVMGITLLNPRIIKITESSYDMQKYAVCSHGHHIVGNGHGFSVDFYGAEVYPSIEELVVMNVASQIIHNQN